jgi:predicted porin
MRSGVILVVRDDFDKRYHRRMKIRELLAGVAGYGNLNFGRNVLVRHLDLEDLIA